jgi:hypothetical protein
MIVRIGSKFVLYSRSGVALGTHRTKREAEAQETAVQISKARAAGHDIPAVSKQPRPRSRPRTKKTRKS